MTILKEAVEAVLDRRAYYREAEAYYEGNVSEVFASARLRSAMRGTANNSARLNFCRPVVDAVNDRLEIANISGSTQVATAKINEIWENNDLGLEAEEIHRTALVHGDCYVMVWPGADGEIQVSYHSPVNTTLVYDPENPREKLYAVKMWKVSDKETRMNIYTADAITKYRTNTGEVTEGVQWYVTETVDNPFGEVPVFHFRTHRPFGRPEHYDAYAGQDAINKLFVTNMHTIDYQGAPQRYALSALGDEAPSDFEEGDTERENIDAMKASPGSVWFMRGVTQMGEFKPADSDAFWKPIDKVRDSIAALTSTPVHYLTKMGQMPTGSSLRTAEAPLLKKILSRQIAMGYAWRDLFRFCLKIEGIKAEVVVTWKAHESLDELERWDIALKKINSGLSHRQALREGGYTEDQIEAILQERKQEAAEGLYYQRAPQTRVDTNNDETAPLDSPNADELGGANGRD